jgi:hypothetical protein
LAVLSLAVMPTLAFAKQRVGNERGSRALVADSKETWVCSYLSLTLLLGVGAYALLGWSWADPVGALAMLPGHHLAGMGDAGSSARASRPRRLTLKPIEGSQPLYLIREPHAAAVKIRYSDPA